MTEGHGFQYGRPGPLTLYFRPLTVYFRPLTLKAKALNIVGQSRDHYTIMAQYRAFNFRDHYIIVYSFITVYC